MLEEGVLTVAATLCFKFTVFEGRRSFFPLKKHYPFVRENSVGPKFTNFANFAKFLLIRLIRLVASPISLFLGVTRDVADFAISAFWDLAVKEGRPHFLVKKHPALLLFLGRVSRITAKKKHFFWALVNTALEYHLFFYTSTFLHFSTLFSLLRIERTKKRESKTFFLPQET